MDKDDGHDEFALCEDTTAPILETNRSLSDSNLHRDASAVGGGKLIR